MLQNAMLLIHVWLGNWWAFGGLFLLTGVVFGYLVPRAKAPIFAAVTTDLSKRVLDEYMMTWRAHDAERFFREIGPTGREAYRTFYRRTDFCSQGWSLACCMSASWRSLSHPLPP